MVARVQNDPRWRKYWIDVRTEIINVWKHIPEDASLLYPPQQARVFVELEDCLKEIKYKYYESVSYIPQHPMDASLRERLDSCMGRLRQIDRTGGIR